MLLKKELNMMNMLIKGDKYVDKKGVINMLLYQILAHTIHGKI